MTLTIDLNPKVEESLAAKAKERGMSLEAYLQEIVSKRVHSDRLPNAKHEKILNLPSRHLGD